MKELFKIKDLTFNEEDFIDEIEEYEDIVELIRDMQEGLSYEIIETTDESECCGEKKNYFIEIQGYINGEDEFITKEEADKYKDVLKNEKLDLFVIRVYKCIKCGAWLIDILE